MIEFAEAVACLCIGAAVGALIVVSWKSKGRRLVDQFNDMHHAPENIEQRSRRVQ